MEAGTPQLVKLEDLHVPGQLSGRKHILSILVENKPGVLARIAGLFSRRGFNIDTLAVGPTDDPSVSRITLTLDGAVHPIDQVTKQLHKLVNVLKIRDMEPEETVAREMAMFKVSAAVESRAEIIQFAEIFRAKIIDVSRRAMTIEVTAMRVMLSMASFQVGSCREGAVARRCHWRGVSPPRCRPRPGC